MKIIIKDTKNKRTVIEINENDKIKDLKNKIKETLRMNNSNFYLHFNGAILEDDNTISECDIENMSTLLCATTFKAGINNLFN